MFCSDSITVHCIFVSVCIWKGNAIPVYTMKAYGEIRAITLFILKCDIQWRWVGNFILWPLYLLSKRQGQDIFLKIYLFWRRGKPLGIETSKCSNLLVSVAIVLTCCLCVCVTQINLVAVAVAAAICPRTTRLDSDTFQLGQPRVKSGL